MCGHYSRHRPELLTKALELSREQTKQGAVEVALREYILRRLDPASLEDEDLENSVEAIALRRSQFEGLLNEVSEWTSFDTKEFSEAIREFDEG